MSERKQLVELNDKIDCLPQEEIPTFNNQAQMVTQGQSQIEPQANLEAPEMRQIIELNENGGSNE